MTVSRFRLIDIAKKAGVSTGTVDRVLHNRGEVSDVTRNKVLQIAKEFNYQPNLLARGLNPKSKIHLATLLPQATQEEIFWQKHLQGINQAIAELEQYHIDLEHFFFDINNEAHFQQQTLKILELEPKGVILAPLFKKESLQFCSELDKRGIPYIFIDTNLASANSLSYIGENAFQGGRIAAYLIDYGLSPDKDVLVVNIAKNLENIHHLNSRTQGFYSYFLDAGRNQGLKSNLEIPTSSRTEIQALLGKVLDNNPNLAAIFVTSSKVYKIAQYLEESHRKDILLVGYDLTEKNLHFLQQKTIQFLIGQRPSEQGSLAVRTLFDFLLMKKTPSNTQRYLPVDIISPENWRLFGEYI